MFRNIIKAGIARPAAMALRAAGATGTFGGTAPVRAGECPADRISVNSNRPGETRGRGVTDSILATVQLSEEPAGIQGRQLPLRRLVVEPGGIVPWHSHGNRPAIIYIVEGQVTEYAATCAIPILHRAGETAVERNPTTHWWRNTGDRPVVLLSADLFPTAEDAHVM